MCVEQEQQTRQPVLDKSATRFIQIREIKKGAWSSCSSNLQPNKNIGRIDLEWWFCDNASANVHERVQEVSEIRSGLFESNHKGTAVELFIGEIQECDDALSEVYMLGVFSINVQGLGLLRKVEDDTIKYSAQVG